MTFQQRSSMQVPINLKIRYLSRRMEEISKLMLSLDQGDFSYAQMIGHQIKGNAATFDIPQIAPLGVEIEKAALIRDEDRVRMLIQHLEQMIQSARSELRS
jgi:HPt (histidine-containing phosphotransfer) domain-containing protein